MNVHTVLKRVIRDDTPIEYDPFANTVQVMDGPHRGYALDVDEVLTAYRAEVKRLRVSIEMTHSPLSTVSSNPEGPDDRYVAQLEAEIQKLRDVIERACGALTTLGATNWERVQAAGLILANHTTPRGTMNYAAPTSKADLLAILDDMRAGVESGDTLEGFVQFSVPYPPVGEPEEADWMVLTRYRVGNLQGQGGLRSLGAMERVTLDRVKYELHDAVVTGRTGDSFIVTTVLGPTYGFAIDRQGGSDVLQVTPL